MIIFRELRELLAELNAGNVEYMVVGGYAVAHHGHRRYTDDLDIFYRPSPANAAALHDAIVRFGYISSDLTASELENPKVVHWIGSPPMRIDFMGSVTGIGFDEAWADKITGSTADGLEFPVLGFKHLIAAKRAAGRPKDLIDVIALESPRDERDRVIGG